jgi:hypothetical protein
MAVTFVDSGQHNSATLGFLFGSSNVPSHDEGDLALAVVLWFTLAGDDAEISGTSGDNPLVAVGSRFEAILPGDGSPFGYLRAQLYQLRVGAGGIDAETVSFDQAIERVAVHTLIFRGAADVVGASMASESETSSAAHTVPSVTGTDGGVLVAVHLSFADPDDSTWTVDAAMTERETTLLTVHSDGATATEALSADEATGTRSPTTPDDASSLTVAVPIDVAPPQDGDVDLSGSGTLSAAGDIIRDGDVDLSGSGALSASGDYIAGGQAALGGAGQLAVVAEVIQGSPRAVRPIEEYPWRGRTEGGRKLGD